MVLVYYYIAILYLITFSSGEGYYTKHLGNYFVLFLLSFILFFCLSIGFRGSRESLHSGMTYNARRGSNASIYQEGDYLFIFNLFFSLILFLFFLLILPLLPFRYCFFSYYFPYFSKNKTKIHSDDDYYYGGSMRDLSSRRGNRRKSSSASHIGKNTKPRKLI